MAKALLSVLCLVLFGCGSNANDYQTWMTPNDKIKVLSTTAMIDDLVKQVGGEYVDTTVLIKGELDPHSYQLVKGDDEKLAFAQVIFANGVGLEHGPSLQNYLKNNSKVVFLGDRIKAEDPKLILSYNGQNDPHIWTDISLWMRTLPFIVEALSKQDPAHAELFRNNADKVRQAMEKEHLAIRDEMQQIPQQQRYLVTSHDAFNYFARAYLADEPELQSGEWQKRFAAPEGLAPESQLSVAEIQLMIDYLKKHDIHMIFPESNVSKDSIRKIVSAGKEKGLNVKIASDALYADAMGPPGSDGDTYLKMMEHNGRVIADYLKKNYP
jgi:manganese/zinc/iron transport system substrate-binding protein